MYFDAPLFPCCQPLGGGFYSAISSSWGTDEVKRITQQLCPAPALQIRGFQVPKDTAGATLGSVITNVANPTLP